MLLLSVRYRSLYNWWLYIPSNFTVFTAASGDQTSKPLEEAKHGMFSYFLMKGMEGDADSNNDKKITALELHNYVRENVVQQSSGSQTPELQGDALTHWYVSIFCLFINGWSTWWWTKIFLIPCFSKCGFSLSINSNQYWKVQILLNVGINLIPLLYTKHYDEFALFKL